LRFCFLYEKLADGNHHFIMLLVMLK